MDFVSSSSYPGFWQALPCKHLLSGVEEHLLMQLLSAVMGLGNLCNCQKKG